MREELALYRNQCARRLKGACVNTGDRLYLQFHGTPTKNRFPNFFVIGAMKAGTTALHDCLAQHPDIFMSYAKEPSLFMDRSPWLAQNPSIGRTFLGRSLSCWDLSEDRWCGAQGGEAAGADSPATPATRADAHD